VLVRNAAVERETQRLSLDSSASAPPLAECVLSAQLTCGCIHLSIEDRESHAHSVEFGHCQYLFAIPCYQACSSACQNSKLIIRH